MPLSAIHETGLTLFLRSSKFAWRKKRWWKDGALPLLTDDELEELDDRYGPSSDNISPIRVRPDAWCVFSDLEYGQIQLVFLEVENAHPIDDRRMRRLSRCFWFLDEWCINLHVLIVNKWGRAVDEIGSEQIMIFDKMDHDRRRRGVS